MPFYNQFSRDLTLCQQTIKFFDTVDLSVTKIVPEMIYYLLGGTLNVKPYTLTTDYVMPDHSGLQSDGQ